MAAQKTIKIPICYKYLKGIKFESSSASNSGVTVDHDKRQIRIAITDDPKPNPAKIKIRIAAGDPYKCEDQDWIWWNRGIEKTDDCGNPILERLPTLSVQNPELCQWEEAMIHLYGPPGCGDPMDEHAELRGKTFEEYDAGYDGKGDYGQIYSQWIPNFQIVPGMNIKLIHKYTDGKRYIMGDTWWCTCCFTGGEVTQIHGEYGDPNIFFTVEIEGDEYAAYPTDFVEWSIGDWVFLIKQGGECANQERTDPCKDACIHAQDLPSIKIMETNTAEGGTNGSIAVGNKGISATWEARIDVGGAEGSGVIIAKSGGATQNQTCDPPYSTPFEFKKETTVKPNFGETGDYYFKIPAGFFNSKWKEGDTLVFTTIDTAEAGGEASIYRILPMQLGSYGA